MSPGDDVYDSYVNLSGTITAETVALRQIRDMRSQMYASSVQVSSQKETDSTTIETLSSSSIRRLASHTNLDWLTARLLERIV